MRKTIALLVLLLACILPALAQTNPFALGVFPSQLSATVSKNPGGAVWLPQAITIAVPLNTADARSYQVYSPLNYQSFTPIRFSAGATQTASKVFSGVAYANVLNQVFIQVDTTVLTPGFYTVPIGVLDAMTGSTPSVILNLTVVDGHSYMYPDPGTKIVPHLASGAGWCTTLQLTSSSSNASAVEVEFFAPDGTPTAYRLADGRNTAVTQDIVNGFGTKSLTLEDAGNRNTLSGSALVKTIYGPPVGVTILYQATDSAEHEAAVPALPATADNLTLFFDNTQGRVTGLALSNSLNYAEPVQVTYYDENGNPLATSVVTLNAHGQTAFVVGDPAMANRKGVILATMPFPALSGFVLRFNKDFQFIPVLPF
jgi:hypothetical protein